MTCRDRLKIVSGSIASGGPAETFSDRLAAFYGVGPGFGHLRILLALSILLWHSFSISYGLDYARQLPSFPVPPLLSSLLPMFFGLSGFLVMGSALRTGDLRKFLLFRSLRIIPALFTEITISAFLLGPLLTTLPLEKYFSDPLFLQYLGSIIGRVRFVLPGLFATNPAPDFVNFALWTVGPEIICYIIMSLLMLTGFFQRPSSVLKITLGYGTIYFCLDAAFSSDHIGEVLPAGLLILAFLLGATFYQFRGKIIYSKSAAAVGFLLALLFVSLGQRYIENGLFYLSVPLFVYVAIVIGLTKIPKSRLIESGDYSYGIYIYGFPIQQSVAHFLPYHREWWVNFGISLPVVLLIASLSWHLIEAPFLKLRNYPYFVPSNPHMSSRARALAIVIVSIYGFFLADANSTFPIRPAVKAIVTTLLNRPMIPAVDDIKGRFQ